MKTERNFSSAVSLFIGYFIIFCNPAQAASLYWDVATGTWATAANWSTSADGLTPSSAAPNSADSAIFSGSNINPGTNLTVSLSASQSAGTLQFLAGNTGTTFLQSSSSTNRTLILGVAAGGDFTGVNIAAGAGAVTLGTSSNPLTIDTAAITPAGSFTETWNNNSANLFTVNANVTSNQQSSSIFTYQLGGSGLGGTLFNGIISDSGTSSNRQTALTINTTGGVTTLAGANTFTGNTTLLAGSLTIANGLALQNSILVQSGGTFSFGSLTAASIGLLGGTSALALQNGSSGTVNLTLSGGANHSSAIYKGSLSGSGTLIVNAPGETQYLAGTNGGYTGNIFIKSGKLGAGDPNTNLSVSSALGTGTIFIGDTSGSNTATLVYSASSAASSFSNPLNVVAGSSGLALINSNSGPVTFTGGVTLNKDLQIQNSNITLSNMLFTGSFSGAGNLTLKGLNVGSLITLSSSSINYAGTLTNIGANSGTSVSISGVIGPNVTGVVQNGLSTMYLAGINTFIGPITITNGALFMNGSVAASTSLTTVASGATLGGSGTIGEGVNVSGTLSPGNLATAIGRLTLAAPSGDALNLGTNGGTFLWQLGAFKDNNNGGVAGADFDRVSLSSGNLVLGGTSKLTLSFSGIADPNSANAFWAANHSWTIVDGAAGVTNTGATNFSTITNGSYTNGVFMTSADSSGNLTLFYSAVPEPSSLLQIASSLGFLCLRRFRYR